MKKNTEEEVLVYQETTNTVRVRKAERRKRVTELEVNKGIKGDSIEVMLERIREGEGEEGIPDRDLVYNETESSTINPITNIRSDRMELMLEEKMGEYDHKHRKAPMKIVKDDGEENKEENKEVKGGEEGKEAK